MVQGWDGYRAGLDTRLGWIQLIQLDILDFTLSHTGLGWIQGWAGMYTGLGWVVQGWALGCRLFDQCWPGGQTVAEWSLFLGASSKSGLNGGRMEAFHGSLL